MATQTGLAFTTESAIGLLVFSVACLATLGIEPCRPRKQRCRDGQ
ncbi:MAG TPA: hypothetical protein VJP78_13290 [Thermoleophilia bacterium]|nr:hypothetical protein [Thermoleophilia bacterium]